MTAAAMHWLVYVVLGGGALLLFGWLLTRFFRQPVKRQRIGEWSVAAALLLAAISLAPSWWTVELPMVSSAGAPTEPQAAFAAPVETSVPDAIVSDEPIDPLPDDAVFVLRNESEDREAVAPAKRVEVGEDAPANVATHIAADASSEVAKVAPAARTVDYNSLLRIAFWLYLGGVAYYFLRHVRGRRMLHRIVARARPLSESERERICRITAIPAHVRLLVSSQVRAPFSFGWLRPTIVLPRSMFRSVAEPLLRYVVIHELTHVRRRDAIGLVLLQAGEIAFYFVPWFWWLARHVRLSREHVADGAVARETGSAEDYAQFLLSWKCTPAPPIGATGVFGNSSDLYRRIAMLVKKNPNAQQHCTRRWTMTLAVALLGVAVAVAGMSLSSPVSAKPVEQDKNKDENKPADPDKQPEKAPKANPQIPDFGPDFGKLWQDFDPNDPDDLRRRIEEMQKRIQEQMRQMRMRFPQVGPGGAFPVFPNDPNSPFGNFGRRGDRDGRLGVGIKAPSATLADQLDLPLGQGMVIENVLADSAAEKVGLQKHDVLLEINGKPVPNDARKLNEMLSDIPADKAVNVVVLRKGKNETLKGLKLPKAPPQGAFPNFPGGNRFPRNPRFPIPQGGIGNGSSSSMQVNGDQFTSRYKTEGLEITVKGTLKNNVPAVSEVNVKDGDQTFKFDTLEEVPEKYRKRTERMLPNRPLRRPKGRFQID